MGKGSDYVHDFKGNGLNLGKTRAERKTDFANMLIDNKNVYEKFLADDKFSFEQIRNIIHLYNTGEQYRDLEPVRSSAMDYVITPQNDTVHGRINNDFFKGYFTFKENNKSDFIKIDSSVAKEFFYAIENANFILKALPGQSSKEFVKW